MASERAAALGDELAAANRDAIDFAQSCSPEQWQTLVPGEEWPVGVVVHHIAESYALSLGWLHAMTKGQGVTDTGPDIDARNLYHSSEWADVTVAEAVALLTSNGLALEATVRALTDEELDGAAPFGPADGAVLPTNQLAGVLVRHPAEHLARARQAIAAPD